MRALAGEVEQIHWADTPKRAAVALRAAADQLEAMQALVSDDRVRDLLSHFLRRRGVRAFSMAEFAAALRDPDFDHTYFEGER
jgi:hypothetical protein